MRMLERMIAGEVPRKHHTALRSSGGQLRYEECLTRAGFEGPYTILYHERRPHEQRIAPVAHGWRLPESASARPLARRHYNAGAVSRAAASAVDARLPLLFNEDVVIGVLRPSAEDACYVSDGDSDTLFFVLEGSGVLRSVLGDLRFGELDYVCVPRGIIYRMLPDAGVPQFWLSLELSGGLKLPQQFRNEVGQLKMDAPYCHRDFRRVEFTGPRDEGIRHLLVKKNGAFFGFEYTASPLDVIGWDGAVYPWALPILAFQPRVAAVHLPPTWHGTFAGRGSLICSFVPRPLDFHPDAIPCPYPHSSVDIDEVIFYARGNFTSRKGVGRGSISHHPAGIPHGPHPGAYESSPGSAYTDELAVMLDCQRPLVATPVALEIEDPGYHDSFIA
jgi:homogentisate 1,2-dioxygenase